MPITIKCRSCGFIFYEGKDLRAIDTILSQWGYRCPVCMSPVARQLRIKVGEEEARTYDVSLPLHQPPAPQRIQIPERRPDTEKAPDPVDYEMLARKYVESAIFRETTGKQLKGYRRLVFLRYAAVRSWAWHWVKENLRGRRRLNYALLYEKIAKALQELGYEEISRTEVRNKEIVFRLRDDVPMDSGGDSQKKD